MERSDTLPDSDPAELPGQMSGKRTQRMLLNLESAVKVRWLPLKFRIYRTTFMVLPQYVEK
jgi:hypothetical protein